jgi:hypothetical protein
MNFWLYLFGSYSRGDFDEYSDLDILLIYNGELNENNEINKIIKNKEQELNKLSNVSIYSVDSLNHYYNIGHLFAWHLALESKLIYTNLTFDFLKNKGNPREYKHASDDYNVFIKVLNGIILETKASNWNLLLEACNFYTVLRNCFFLFLYKNHQNFFFSPYEIFNYKYELPIDLNNYTKYRKIKQDRYFGNHNLHGLNKEQFLMDLECFYNWIKEVNMYE